MTGSKRERPAAVVLAAGLAKRYGGCKPLAPVGPHGEPIIDLLAGDLLAAGFGRIVVVLGPATGAAITYHIERCWPRDVDVAFADQPVPLGTAHALLCARHQLGNGTPFAAVNADDLYGAPALAVAAEHLEVGGGHALVAFHLLDSVATDSPVTRGICTIDAGGNLSGISERRLVHRLPNGEFVSEDGLEPAKLDGDAPVSMNLWAFESSIWDVLEEEVLSVHPDAPIGRVPGGAAGSHTARSQEEVLLPEVVARRINGNGANSSGRSTDHGLQVRALRGPGRCIGVTHADDLPSVRSLLAAMIAEGRRPPAPFANGIPC
jgi:hypothetical protein